MGVVSVVVFVAFIIDLVIGDPEGFPHTVIYMGRLIKYLERLVRLRFKSLKMGGLAIWLVLVGITYSMSIFISNIFGLILGPMGAWALWGFLLDTGISIILMATCLSTRCLALEAKKVYKKLIEGDIKETRLQLSYIVGRDTSSLSESEIIRATVETVAENTVDGTISPIFFAMLGGVPLAMVYKAVNTMDSMLGYKNEKYINIGRYPAILDDVFNFIPARLSLLFFTIASAICGYDWRKCLEIGYRDRKNHKSPNCAYSEGAVAGALGIQLGGTNVYFGQEVYKPTIGDKTRDLQAEDILSSIKLLYVTSIVSLLALLVFRAIVF